MKTVDFADICNRVPLNATASRVTRWNVENDVQEEWFCLNKCYQDILEKLKLQILPKYQKLLLETQKRSVIKRKKELLKEYPFLGEL